MNILSISFCLSFLLNLRASAIGNVYHYVRDKYGISPMKSVYKLSGLRKKLEKAKLDSEFLITCKTYNVFPKFLRFRLYKKSLEDSSIYRSWQAKLLSNEIGSKKKSSKKIELQINNLQASLRIIFSRFDILIVNRLLDKQIALFTGKTRKTHDKKLSNLGIHGPIQPHDPDKVIFNFSSTPLSPRLKTLLAFGLDFGLPVFKINFYSYFLAFEKLVHNLKEKCDISKRGDFVNEVRSVSQKFFYNFKPFKIFCNAVSKSDISLLKQFASNKSLIVSKPDKGRAVVIMNRADYVSSMNNVFYHYLYLKLYFKRTQRFM